MSELSVRAIPSNQLVWASLSALAAIVMVLATGLWTYQQGQVTAVAAMAASNSNRITALEVEVKQLQESYLLINTKLDQISARQITAAAQK